MRDYRGLADEEMAMSLDFFIYAECDGHEIEISSYNVTHNLTRMADAVGLYKPLWRPEELGITRAGDLVPLLEAGYARLIAASEGDLAEYEPSNGWGSREGLERFVRKVLRDCKKYPSAVVSACR